MSEHCPAKIGQNSDPFIDEVCLKSCFKAAMLRSRRKGAVTHPVTEAEIEARWERPVSDMPQAEDRTIVRKPNSAERTMIRERGYDPFEPLDAPKGNLGTVEVTHMTTVQFECPNEAEKL